MIRICWVFLFFITCCRLPADAPRGWTLARYAGLNLGWLKVLPGRMNNYLPAERRIRMDITGFQALLNAGGAFSDR